MEDPCKESDAAPTSFEIKKQGKDIGDGDPLRKYSNPCKPPPFLHQEELQAPGLPSIPVPPPLEMPSMFDTNPFMSSNARSGNNGNSQLVGDSGDRAGLAAALNVLSKMRQEE